MELCCCCPYLSEIETRSLAERKKKKDSHFPIGSQDHPNWAYEEQEPLITEAMDYYCLND